MTIILLLIAVAALVVWGIAATVRAVRTDGYAPVERRDALREFDRPAYA
ncbi:hypothetical protein [Agromyces protaetiae]|nr:hypothetical protein [Agromyces protaetiae]